MASGHGSSFGRALLNALAAEAGGTVGVRRSYTAKGWHAQISKLTSSDRGYQAAERAGLSVNHRTLVDWLAERREPNAENQRKIAKAYGLMRGQWPERVESAEFNISGQVKTGSDVRDRGNRMAPLSIDGSQGQWARMKQAWEEGETDDDDEWEEWFVEDVIDEDLGEGSEGWEFPGGSYTVTIS